MWRNFTANKQGLVDFFFNQLTDGFYFITLKNAINLDNLDKPEDIVSILFEDGQITQMNDRFLEQIQLPGETIKNLKPESLFKQKSNEIKEHWINFFLRNKKVFEYQLIIENRTIWVETNLTSVFNKKGLFTGLFAIQKEIGPIKTALKALKESEERYQKLASFSFEGIVILKNNKITDVNDSFTILSGYMKEELVGMSFIDSFIYPTHKQYLTEYFNSDSSLPVEIEFIRKDKLTHFVEIETRKIVYKGEELRVLAVRDITARKISEEEINKLQIAVEQSANIIVITNITGTIEYVNKSFTKVTGYLPEEVIGENPRILKSDLMPREFYENMWSIISKGKQWYGEFLNRKKNGELYWENSTITPVKNKSGTIINFIAIKEDITNRKNTEQALKDSERQFRTLVTNIPGVIFRFNFDNGWNINYISNGIESLTGYKATDFINNSKRSFVSIIHPDDIERVIDTLTMGVNNFKQYTVEYRLITKNGKYKWVTDKGTAVIGEDNKIKWLDGLILDISDRVKVIEEYKKAKSAAEKANKSKSEFLANMSHEIRTPLNSILGFTELLEETLKEETQMNYLNSIKLSSKNLLILINDILNLSKVESGKIELAYSFFNPRIILKEISQIFALKLAENEIKLVTDVQADFPEVIYMDEGRLRQIFLNVVGNAIKFTEKGEVRLSLYATEETGIDASRTITIEISDTGIGIPDDSLDIIFESFRQQSQHDSKKYEGTGLGLSITKRLVEIMDGGIFVESEVGKGSKFTIIFYNVLCNTSAVSFEKTPKNFNYHEVIFNRSKLLIADDQEEVRNYVKSVFKDKEIELLEAVNGQEAVDISIEKNPDVIILDIRMPVLSGVDALQKLKSIESTKNIPVIAFTASHMEKDNINYIEQGFDSIVLKPVNITGLYSEIMKYIPYKLNVKENIPAKKQQVKPNIPTGLREEFYSLFKPQWEKFNKKQPIKEVTLFAQDIIDFGKKYKIIQLIDYGKGLIGCINSFDIEKMGNHLNKFNSILDV